MGPEAKAFLKKIMASMGNFGGGCVTTDQRRPEIKGTAKAGTRRGPAIAHVIRGAAARPLPKIR